MVLDSRLRMKKAVSLRRPKAVSKLVLSEVEGGARLYIPFFPIPFETPLRVPQGYRKKQQPFLVGQI